MACQSLLRAEIGTFRDLTQSPEIKDLLNSEQIEQVVLQASFALYGRATATNIHKGELKIAHDM